MKKRLFLVFFLFFALAGMLFFLQSVHAQDQPVVCGNGVCESPIVGGNENSCTCPQDCGACAPGPFEVCRKYSCDSNNICRQTLISTRTTGQVCCQNQLCEAGESFGNCPQDCGPAEITLDIVSPVSLQSFVRGETGLVSVKVSSSGRSLAGADVKATGFFGGINLYNDGKHGDGTNFDNVYANYFVVPGSAKEGPVSFVVNAEFQEAKGTKELGVLVNPELAQSLEAPALVFLGENISIGGTVKRGSEPAVFSFDLNLLNPRGIVAEKKKIATDSAGAFSYSFHTSLIDPLGDWTINGYGLDGNNNRFGFSRIVRVEDPSRERFLAVDFSSDKAVAPKGETVVFIATVTDFGVPVNDATVELTDSLSRRFSFSFLSDGQYSVSYVVPFEMPVGEQKFSIHASRLTGITVEGTKEFSLLVQGKSFAAELLLPAEKKFSIGDVIRFRVHAQYAPNQPVLDANSFVIVNGQRVLLAAEGSGFYAGEYVVQESDAGSLSFEAVVSDHFENKSSVFGTVEVFGVGPLYYVQRFGTLFLLLAAAFSLAFFAAYRIVVKRLLIERLQKRRAELVELEKTIQSKYFEQAAIEKTEFEQFMGSYETEIKEVDKKLFKLTKTLPPQNPDAALEKPEGGIA